MTAKNGDGRGCALIDPHQPRVLLYRSTDEPEDPDPTGLPDITFGNRQLPSVTAEGLAALALANDPPRIFERGGALTRLRDNTTTGGVYLEALDANAVRGRIARCARWFRAKAGGKYAPDAPPTNVVRDLMALPNWDGIPTIEPVVETPVFGRHGRLVAEPGYDPESHLYYHPAEGFALPPVPERPTSEDIDEARRWLLVELLGDFPFADQASRANALALLLLPFARPMVAGPTPLHLIDAPTPGSSKTLLAEVVGVAATGRPLPATAESVAGEEIRRRITAMLIESPSLILLDNVNSNLDSGVLASVLTSTVWRDRVLKWSKTATVPNHAIWIATGNNVHMSQELLRRSIWVRLDAGMERPWERTTFRHPKLLLWAMEHRAQLVWAALTLCQAWLAAGRPQGGQTLGMYESWVGTLGGILDVAGVPGLLGNAQEFRAAAADHADEWSAFVRVWWARHANAEVIAGALLALATENHLLGSVIGAGGERSQHTKFGLALSKKNGQVVGGYRIVRAGEDRCGRWVWRLDRLGVNADHPQT